MGFEGDNEYMVWGEGSAPSISTHQFIIIVIVEE
jgi:hypothetical protein